MIKTFSFNGINASVYLPEGYDVENKTFPLIPFLHGIGERGNTVEDLSKINNFSFLKTLEKLKLPVIGFAPQLKTNYSAWPIKTIDICLKWAIKNLKVDPDKIVLHGISLGGGGVWGYAQSTSIPYTINKIVVQVPVVPLAGIVPICGHQNNPLKAPNVTMPVWAFHGLADTVVYPNVTVRMITALEKIGFTPKATYYEGVNHNSWDKAYADSELWKWILTQTL